MRFKESINEIKEWLSSDSFEAVYKILAVITALCLVFSYALTRDYKKDKGDVEIKAYIKGEVVNPGVYSLGSDGRISELIEAAGGLTDKADTDGINLAERVLDEEVITIPGLREQTDTTLVNINTATKAELDKLPGIGSTFAQRIIDHREKYGKFKKIEYIMNVDGIGEDLFSKIKNLITI